MECPSKKAKTTTQMPVEEDGPVPSLNLSTDIIDKAIQDYFRQEISAAISKDANDLAKLAAERQNDVDVATTGHTPTSSNTLTMQSAWHQSTGGKDNNK